MGGCWTGRDHRPVQDRAVHGGQGPRDAGPAGHLLRLHQVQALDEDVGRKAHHPDTQQRGPIRARRRQRQGLHLPAPAGAPRDGRGVYRVRGPARVALRRRGILPRRWDVRHRPALAASARHRANARRQGCGQRTDVAVEAPIPGPNEHREPRRGGAGRQPMCRPPA